MIKKMGGWGNFTGLLILVLVILFSQLRKCDLVKKAAYTKGVSQGISKSVRGNYILDYTFTIGSSTYKGFVPSTFCNNCSCCKKGDTVIVQYEDTNPSNNDLVKELPAQVKR